MRGRVTPRAGRLALLGAAALFSTGGAAIKLCSLPGWSVAGLRSGLAAVFLLVVTEEGRRLRSTAVWLVGCSYAATMILFVLANRETTAASTVFLQATAPLYALGFGLLLLGERPHRSDGWTALFLVPALALFLARPGGAQETAPHPALGNALAAAAGVSWGLTLTGLRHLARTSRATLAAVTAGNVLAFVVSFCVQRAALVPAGVSALDLGVLLWLGAFQIGLAYVLVGVGLRATPVLLASLLLLVEPVLSPVFAWLAHGEVPSTATVVGGLVVLAACARRALAAPHST